MSSDRTALATLRRTRHRNPISFDIKYGEYLRPWMMLYAEWLILSPELPTRAARGAHATSLGRTKVSWSALYALEARPDFRAYCEELQRGPLEQARAKFRSRLPEYIDAHYEALDRAREAGDYKATAQISEVAIDRVMPKKGDAVQATQVTIMLTPSQLAGLQTYESPEVTVEEVLPDAQHDD